MKLHLLPANVVRIAAFFGIVVTLSGTTSVIAAGEGRMYTGTDDAGTLVFSDDPGKVLKPAELKKNNSSRRLKKVVNRTPRGAVPAKFKDIPPLLESAINSYCSYDLKTLKKITLPAYWPAAETDITYIHSSFNDQGRSYIRNYCFTWFEIVRIKESSGRMANAGDVERPLAEVLVRAWRDGDERGEGYGYHVTFVKDQGVWKYYNIVNGPIGIFPSDLQ